MTLESELARHAPFLRALARRLVADPSTADDLVQETWVAALAARAAPGSFAAWLTGVLQKRALRLRRGDRRRQRREQAVASDGAVADVASVQSQIETARRLLQHVEALDADSREVVLRRYYQGLPPRRIADELGLPVATVKTRLARALSRLRERLDADEPQRRRHWLPALCAFADPTPSAAAATASSPPGRGLRTLRWQLAAATAVAILPFVAGPWSWFQASHAPAIRTAAQTPSAAAPADGAGDVHRTEATSQVATVVPGLVEDAGLGAAAGTGTPAANVVVRYQLRRARTASGTTRTTAATQTPDRLPVPPVASTQPEVVETTTDAQGRFHIAVPADTTLVRVDVPGDAVVRAAHWSAADRAAPPPTQLVLTRYVHGVLVGTVLDPAGTAVPGATVRLVHREQGAPVAVETVSDANGQFRFTTVHPDAWLEAGHAGFVQVSAAQPRPRRLGGFDPAAIVLARAAHLHIEVVSTGGSHAAAADGIGVAIAPDESGLLAQTNHEHTFRRAERLGAEGATVVVPAAIRLALWVGDTLFLRASDGTAVPATPATGMGSPIVLAADEHRTLRVELSTDTEVQVTVVGPDEQPVPGAEVQIERITRGRVESMRLAKADAAGRFTHRTSAVDEQTLLVTASSAGQQLRAARRVVAAGTAPVPVRLQLAAPQFLTGTVRDAAGHAVDARVHCWILTPGAEPAAYEGYRRTDLNGVFRVPAIADSRYQLEISSEHHATTAVDDVRPDVPLDIVVARKGAQLRLRTRAAVPLREVQVHICRARDEADTDASWPQLHGGTPWSHGAAPGELMAGPERRRDERWRHERFSRPVAPGGELDLALEVGRAWISLRGRESDGALLTLVTTGPVTIPPGDTEMMVEFAPTALCRGRIVFGAGVERFDACVALADDSGRLLAVTVAGLDQDLTDVVATSSHGHFALNGIPPGAWELRVGTFAELARGEARYRRREAFSAGSVAELVVRL